MFRESLLDELTGINTRPNKLSIGMGKLIKAAREEAGYSQRELAERIYRRQAALSDMENGKMEPDATTLLLLSYCLEKPITYFFPTRYVSQSIHFDLTESELEILLLIRKLSKSDLRKLIAQIRAIASIDPNEVENE